MNITRNIPHYLLLLSFTLQAGCASAPWPTSQVAGVTPEERLANAATKRENYPKNTESQKTFYQTKENAINTLLNEGAALLQAGQLEAAHTAYMRVLAMSPENNKAKLALLTIARSKAQLSKLDEAKVAFDTGNFVAAKQMAYDLLLENPSFEPALTLLDMMDESEKKIASSTPALASKSEKPISLQFRDTDIKVIFEAITRVTGINFILDKDIKKSTKATIFVENANIEEAITMVLASNGLTKKNLTTQSAIIYPNTRKKAKDYQELMVRSFYIKNTTSARIADMLRAVLKTKDLYVDDRLNMLVVRDTPEVIHLAQKLVAANDMPDPEVMLDLEVIEVNRTRLQELGIIYPSKLNVATGATMTLDALLNDVNQLNTVVTSYNGENPGVNFKKTTGDINILSNPRLRVKNNEKANISVGDKVPLITTTVVSGNATSASQTVQYLDVGLKLNLQPRVSIDNYVNIKLGLEVNSLGNQVTSINGAPVYQIGSRNANTVLRLKDGETQILGGLISDDERQSTSGLPGFADLPLVGKLFSNNQNTKQKTEIILVITPHIISNIQQPSAKMTEYWSGTESLISDKPKGNFATDAESNDHAINESSSSRNEADEISANTDEVAKESNNDVLITPKANDQPTGADVQNINDVSKKINTIEFEPE